LQTAFYCLLSHSYIVYKRPYYHLPYYLTPFIDGELSLKLKAPIKYINKNGRETQGVLASTLPDI
jgi:hypothetical protein